MVEAISFGAHRFCLYTDLAGVDNDVPEYWYYDGSCLGDYIMAQGRENPKESSVFSNISTIATSCDRRSRQSYST